MDLRNESKTLFIPLVGKALMSKENIIIKDSKAEEIVSMEGLNKLKQSKWLSMYMSLRAVIIDELTNKYLISHKDTTVIHLGCGLDSRVLRVSDNYSMWYDIDYEEVITLRKKYYNEDDRYKMISSSILDYKWLDSVEDSGKVLVIMEGVSMYLDEEEIKELILKLSTKFKNTHLIFDAYSKKGVKLSKYKNPINKYNAKVKYGLDNKEEFLSLNNRLKHLDTHLIKKEDINLPVITKFIFNNLYCGKTSESLYKIYEFKIV